MALDLSALEAKPIAVTSDKDGSTLMGKPMDLLLGDIEEDPEQPRKEFPEEAMREMTASVKLRGVKTPVSVRRHPVKSGKWLLNYGARRYRASVASGKKTIPAFIDETHDDFDQVIENLQRDDLKPMELALFIKKRVEAGDKKSDIAKLLGKDNSVVTQHLALIDPPVFIKELYQSGRCDSPRVLYTLRNLYDQHGDAVEIWCNSVDEITKNGVSTLSKLLISGVEVLEFGPDQIAESVPTSKEPIKDANNSLDHPRRITHPELIVSCKGLDATVLLDRHPTKIGQIHVRYNDGSEKEVDAGSCRINFLRNKSENLNQMEKKQTKRQVAQ